ncbi:MAG: helix-turn-helix domain-containing protein, partial [Deltaproteobacteria bacterium]|nr:helix-turn-helix domain-containing protein [Deltaproteobacteria bacterium]
RPVPKKSIAEKDVLSLPEASDYLGVSDDTTRELAHSGKIPAGQLRRRWRFLKADLNFFIRHNKNPLVAEAEERAKAQEAKPETITAEKVLKPKKPRRTITTALLLKHAVETLSTHPCYLVGPGSQSLLNTHVSGDDDEWDIVAKGSLSEVLSRAADLFLSEEPPKVAYQREELTLPAVVQSLEQVKEKLNVAIATLGFSREDSNKLKFCAGELVDNAVAAGGPELKVIIETGKDDLILTVINEGRVEHVTGKMPGPDSERGRGIELTKKMMDDFLLLSTNDKVIACIRKRRAGS